ncbi:MAG: hypothetical protein KAX16_06090 [Actinomycetia bacterium]|nr:hypothetical protein [Actinomycetes bacterium]
MGIKFKFVGFLVTLIIGLAFFVPLVVAGSNWTRPVKITNNGVEEGDLSMAVHRGRAYIVFVRGERKGREVYLRTNKSGRWKSTRLTRNSTADWAPDIAIDRNGKIHIAYLFGNPRTGGDAEVTYRTNTSGRWRTKVLTNTRAWEENPSIAAHNGKAHIIYGKDPGQSNEIWYANNKAGNWSKHKITGNGYSEEGGTIAQYRGVPQAAYTNRMNRKSTSILARNDDEIYFGKKRLRRFRRITFNSSTDGKPDIAIDSHGKAHIVFIRGDNAANGGDLEVVYATNKSGSWREKRLTNDRTSEDNPTIAISGGKVFVAYERWAGGDWPKGQMDLVFTQKKVSARKWQSRQWITRTAVDEMLPMVAGDQGRAHVAFRRENPDGEIIYFKQK